VGLLDTPPEEAFDRLTRLAARLLRAPVALVSLVEPHRQFLKSTFGLPEPAVREAPLSHSFCKHVVATSAPLVVNDAREHPLVCDNGAVEDLGVVAYLGVPFRAPAGEVLGALCVIDHEPRAWHDEDRRVLEDLAAVLTDEVELRDTIRRREASDRARDALWALTEAAFDAITDIFFVLDLDGELLRWNGRMNEVTGYSDTALAGRSALRFFPEEDRPAVAEAIARVYGEGRATVEADLLTTGGPVAYELNGTPLRDGDGRIIGLCGTARDVSERQRAQEALAQSEARHRGLLEATPDLILRFTREGRYLDVNAPDPTLLAADAESLLGRTIVEVGAEVDATAAAAEWLEAIAAALESGHLQEVTYERLAKDGRRRYLEARIVPVGADEVQAVVRDVTGRHRSREALRASEQFLRGTMNALSAHIAVLDERGVIIATNEAWRRFGHANGAAPGAAGVGADYLAVCDAGGAEGAAVGAAIREALAGHPDDFTMEYPCHSPDEQRWFEVRVTRFPGEAGPRVVVAHEDVTDRRLAGEALRESEVRFRSFVEATAQVVWQADATGAVTELSEEWSAFTGQPHQGAPGWEWLEAIHPGDRERVAEEWAACVAGRVPYETVYRVRTRSGDHHRFSVRAVPVYAEAVGTAAEGGLLGWAGTATDVEEQYRAEEALARSEERLRLALRAAEMGTWDTELLEGAALDEGTVSWSPQTLALFGLGEEAADGAESTFYDLMLEEDRTRVREETAAAIRRAAEGGPPELTVDYRLRRTDGEVRWFRSTGRVVLGDGGRPERMVGTVLDVTDAKVYEAALVEAKEAAEEARRRAEEASRLKSSLLANMSHEIRTPLTGIIGFADVLAEEVEDEHGEFARAIGSNGRRLLDTLNAVLELARLEAGEVQFGRDELDLRAVVAEAVAPLVPRAGAKGLGLTVSLHPEPVLVESDASALGRVVSNLVSNAVKFTEEGGVSVAVRAGAAGAEVRVADTGVGIAPSFLPRLFEAFYQESEGDERSHEGNGLGLVITQRLVERMGGTIEVASEKGVGSAFTVRLPRAAYPE
jgi:PAS domain S-box-containing protein